MPALKLIRAAQWAVSVLHAVEPDCALKLSSAADADLEALVQRAELHAIEAGRERIRQRGLRRYGGLDGRVTRERRAQIEADAMAYVTSRSRRTDLFPGVDNDTVIAQTFRWLLDHHEQHRDEDRLARSVRKVDLMDAYHGYSERESNSRSSFSNNVGPYRHGAGALIEDYVHTVTLLKKNGKPRTRARWKYEPDPNNVWLNRRVPTGERREITRSTEMVVWIGPTAAQWLASMTDADLDRALATMERRLLERDVDTDENPLCPSVKKRGKRVVFQPDDLGATKRWHERIGAEIARRAALI